MDNSSSSEECLATTSTTTPPAADLRRTPSWRTMASMETESVVSLGSEFDRAFDMEVGTFPTKSWGDDTMRSMLFLPSASRDESSCSTRRRRRNPGGPSSRNRLLSSTSSQGGGGVLPPAESDLDQVFDELNELHETEERFVAMTERRGFGGGGGGPSSAGAIHLYQNGNGYDGGIYASSLGSLLEKISTDELERMSATTACYFDMDQQSMRNDYERINGGEDDDEEEDGPEDLFVRAAAHPTPPSGPLSINSQWDNVMAPPQLPSNTSTLHDQTHISVDKPRNNFDDDEDSRTAMTSLMSQSTLSHPSLYLQTDCQDYSIIDGNDSLLDESPRGEAMTPGTEEILYDIDHFLDHVHKTRAQQPNDLIHHNQNGEEEESEPQSPMMETILEEDYGESWDCSCRHSTTTTTVMVAGHSSPSPSVRKDSSAESRLELMAELQMVPTESRDPSDSIVAAIKYEWSERDDIELLYNKHSCSKSSFSSESVSTEASPTCEESGSSTEEEEEEEIESDIEEDDDDRGSAIESNASFSSFDSSSEFEDEDNQQQHAITLTYINVAISIGENQDMSPIDQVLERSKEQRAMIANSAQQMIRSHVPGIQFIGISLLLAKTA